MNLILYFVLTLDLIFLIWHFSTKKYIQPSCVNIWILKIGGGKSCSIAKGLISDVRAHRKCYVNDPTFNINGVRLYDTYDLGNYRVKDAHIYVEEASLFFDNRNFMDKSYRDKTKNFVRWLRACRHEGCTIELYTQSYDVDRKIRTLASSIWIGSKYFRVFTVWRKLKKDVAIKTAAQDAESQIVDELKFEPWFIPGNMKVTFIPRYVKYFNSFNKIMDFEGPMKYRTVRSGIEVRKRKKISDPAAAPASAGGSIS